MLFVLWLYNNAMCNVMCSSLLCHIEATLNDTQQMIVPSCMENFFWMNFKIKAHSNVFGMKEISFLFERNGKLQL